MNDIATQRQQKFINILLLAAAVLSLAAAALGMFTRVIDYRHGYAEGLAGDGNFNLFDSVLVALAALCVWFAALLALLFASALSLANARRPSAARVGLVLMAVVATPLGCCTGSRGLDRFAHGFRDGLREREVDWEAIRTWRKTMPDAEATWMTVGDNDTPLPALILELHPSWVSIRADGAVNIVCGGGFMHWGIDIFPLPHDASGLLPANRDEYLEVAPGVYCWAGE